MQHKRKEEKNVIYLFGYNKLLPIEIKSLHCLLLLCNIMKQTNVLTMISILLLFSFILFQLHPVDAHTLKFNKHGKFKIVQFTDLHYGEYPPEKDINSSKVQTTILKLEQPDLVIMTGDCGKKNSYYYCSFYEKMKYHLS
jgi:predicted MPP superfamily phosphohydrolase